MKFFKSLNTPNKLTVIRLLMVIAIIILSLFDYYMYEKLLVITSNGVYYTWTRFVILGLFLLASYTDHLDGKLARKNNQVTTFGKFLDPIADKALNNSLIIILVAFNEMPFIIPVCYIFRDIVVDGIRLIASSNNKVIAASNLGKFKTVAQVAQITLTLAFFPLIAKFEFIKYVLLAINYFALAASLVSGIDYVIKNKEMLIEGER